MPMHVRIQDFCKTGSGGTPDRSRADYYGGDIPWVKSGELREGIIHSTEEKITRDALLGSSAKMIPAGSLLIAMYGATVGRTAILGIDAATNQAICNIQPDPDRCDVRYLFHFLQSRMKYFVQRAAGGAQPNISQGIIRETTVPLPSIEKQRRVATILDKADALRRKRKHTLELLDGLTQSIFLEMFVQNASSDWAIVKVEDIANDMRTGPFGSQLLHSEFTDDGIPVLGIDNAVANEFRWSERRFISRQKYEKLKRYTVHPGDVLITIMGTCGRCAVVPQSIPVAINTKHLCCTTLDQEKCLPEFLRATFLTDPDVQRQLGVQAKGAVMPGLNMGTIKSLQFRLPPNSIQKLYSDRVAAIKTAANLMITQLNRLEACFASLQHRAFSGQL